MADAKYLSMFGWQGPRLTSSPTNHSVDANNDGIGWIFQANTADAITHLGFRYGLRTGTPPVQIIGLEGVASTGLPDGTYLGGVSPASATFTPPADATWDGTWQWVQLTNAHTPARGDVLAMTIRYSSGTIDASNFSSYTRTHSDAKGRDGFPYGLILAGGTWSKVAGASFGYRTANGRFGWIVPTIANPSLSTTGHRSAIFFTLPADWGDTFTLAGLNGLMRVTAGGSALFGLWDAAGTEIQAVTFDTDAFQQSGIGGQHLLYDGASLTALNYGTEYYAGLQCVGASPIGMSYVDLTEAADRSAFPNGVNCGYASWDGATWTKDDTAIPLSELILGAITEPAGGGGGLLGSSVMTGGFHRA